MCGWQVKLGDRLVTHEPYMIKIKDLCIKRYINSYVYFFYFFCYVIARDNIISTRNTFCGTWYLPHSHVHNERTVPIIMAGCMAHE